MIEIKSTEGYRKILLAILIQALRDVRPAETLSRNSCNWHEQKEALKTAVEFFDTGAYKDLCDNLGMPQELVYKCYLYRLSGREMNVQMP